MKTSDKKSQKFSFTAENENNDLKLNSAETEEINNYDDILSFIDEFISTYGEVFENINKKINQAGKICNEMNSNISNYSKELNKCIDKDFEFLKKEINSLKSEKGIFNKF